MRLGLGLGICNRHGGEFLRSMGTSGLAYGCGSMRHVDEQHVLARVVDGDVLVRLEEAQFAHAFGGDAAGGEIGDGSGGKFDADVGDIDARGEDGQADGAHFYDRGVGEAEHDVEIVDHQVEHDIDVKRARGEDAQAVRLKKHRGIQQRANCGDGGVEALEVADLEDALGGCGEGGELAGFVEGGGDGFFNQDIDASAEELLRDFEVEAGWNTDGGGVDGDVAGGASGEEVFE